MIAIATSVLAFMLWWLLQRISESIAYSKFKTRPVRAATPTLFLTHVLTHFSDYQL